MNRESIRHMVIFCLKYDKDSAETERFVQDGQRILSSIPSVRNFAAFRQISSKNDYDYGFCMDFGSQEDYESYNVHPAHVQFVEERWKVEVERFLEIDFQIV